MIVGILLILVSSAVIGIVLARRGWRGRRVGDHPHCAACGFDLFGLPVQSVRCSECGAILGSAKATRTGVLVRHWGMFFGGLALALGSLLFAGTYVTSRVRGIRWIEHQPLWYLLRNLEPTGTASPADEVLRRIKLGELDSAAKARVRDTILTYQLDNSRRWFKRLGDILLELRADGTVSDDQWAAYLIDSSPPRLMARALTRTGDPLAVQLEKLAGKTANWNWSAELIVKQVQIDGRPIEVDPAWRHQTSGNVVLLNFAIEHPIPAGEHVLTMLVETTVSESRSVNTADPARRSIKLTSPLRVADDALSIHPHSSPDAIDRYREAFTVLRLARAQTASPLLTPPVELSVAFDMPSRISGERYGVAYDVFIRTLSGEYPAGGFAYGPDMGSFSHRLSVPGIPTEVTRADVILRPSFPRAVRHARIDRWLDAELVYKNIPIGSR